MTKYDIITLVISLLALICGVPGGILSIIDIKLRKLRISVSFERQYCIPTENTGTYKLNIRYNIANKSPNPFTIRKIEALYDKHTLEVYKETYNSSGTFENIPIAANACQDFPLSFTYNKPIEKMFKLKIYTNVNVIKQKLLLASDLRYRKESH